MSKINYYYFYKYFLLAGWHGMAWLGGGDCGCLYGGSWLDGGGVW